MHADTILRGKPLHAQLALVAGVGNCIGRATAWLLSAAGAELVLADESLEQAEQLAQQLRSANQLAVAVALDPIAEADWQRVHAVCAQRAPLRLLVNAAQTCHIGPIETVSGEQFHRQLQRNALGAWLGQKHAIAAMRQTTGGVIVNVTSVLARAGSAHCAAYSAAARGVLMSTKSAALECARDKLGIIVNAVLAGRIEGDPAHFPDGRVLPDAPVVSAEDVAAAVLFLASDGASYMTGMELPVDGGWLTQ